MIAAAAIWRLIDYLSASDYFTFAMMPFALLCRARYTLRV